jgi:branched-chain amino acid transport system substrate-binding protein
MSIAVSRRMLVVPLLAGTLVLAACSSSGGASGGGSSSGSASSSKPFTVLFDSGLSGPLASTAALETGGMKAAIQYINAHGGMDGAQVKFAEVDSTGDPTQAVSALEQWESQNGHPSLVLTGITSAEADALVPVLNSQKVLTVSAAVDPTLNDPAKFPYHFGSAADSQAVLTGLKGELTSVGAKSLSVLEPNDAFGVAEIAAVKADLAGSGITVTVHTFDDSATSLVVPYTASVASKPDAMLVDAEGASVPLLFAARLTTGSTGIPTFGGPALTGLPLVSQTPAATLANVKLPVLTGLLYKPASGRSAELNALLSYMKLTNGALAFVPELGFDSVMMFKYAADQAKSTDAAAVAKALEQAKFPANYLVSEPNGTGFSSTNHFPQGAYSWIPALTTVQDGLWNATGS